MNRSSNNRILIDIGRFLVSVLIALAWILGGVEARAETTVLSEDGAWCWFQDPRAVYVAGRRQRTYAGWVTRGGELQLGAFDHGTGQTETVTLKSNWDSDDHNTCSILELPDHRLMVFYARHNKKGLFCRVSSKPEDVSLWDEEVTVSNSDRITYSHPVYLREEGRFYVFWRGPSWKPTFATSMDGKVWSEPQLLVQGKGKESSSIRPYLKVYSDGHSVIHIAFTDGHPRNEPENSVYYLAYRSGAFYRANGGLIASIEAAPIRPVQCDRVYDGSTEGRAWLWDLGSDLDQKPVILYTRLPSETEHHYHFGYWNGSQWVNKHITHAGAWFPETRQGKVESEPHYSAGFTMNHRNPFELFLSRDVAGEFAIEQWVTRDFGGSWVIRPITSHTGVSKVRPVVPRNLPKGMTSVLWMEGHYEHYTRFQTQIQLYTADSNPTP